MRPGLGLLTDHLYTLLASHPNLLKDLSVQAKYSGEFNSSLSTEVGIHLAED